MVVKIKTKHPCIKPQKVNRRVPIYLSFYQHLDGLCNSLMERCASHAIFAPLILTCFSKVISISYLTDYAPLKDLVLQCI